MVENIDAVREGYIMIYQMNSNRKMSNIAILLSQV